VGTVADTRGPADSAISVTAISWGSAKGRLRTRSLRRRFSAGAEGGATMLVVNFHSDPPGTFTNERLESRDAHNARSIGSPRPDLRAPQLSVDHVVNHRPDDLKFRFELTA
jgi:hypothetical protein